MNTNDADLVAATAAEAEAAIRAQARDWSEGRLIKHCNDDFGKVGGPNDSTVMAMLLVLASVERDPMAEQETLRTVARWRANVPDSWTPGPYVWSTKNDIEPVEHVVSRFKGCARVAWFRDLFGWVLLGWQAGDEKATQMISVDAPPRVELEWERRRLARWQAELAAAERDARRGDR